MAVDKLLLLDEQLGSDRFGTCHDQNDDNDDMRIDRQHKVKRCQPMTFLFEFVCVSVLYIYMMLVRLGTQSSE